MPPTCILDEDDALELLALLLTSARTQVDEARWICCGRPGWGTG